MIQKSKKGGSRDEIPLACGPDGTRTRDLWRDRPAF